MSVIFGYVMDKKVYLAADNRITDAEGKFISDDDIKICKVIKIGLLMILQVIYIRCVMQLSIWILNGQN